LAYLPITGQLHEADRYLLDDDKIETTKSKDRAAAHAMQVCGGATATP
jgi:hypothetical protein